jgi:hypothetical protein
VFDQEAVHPGVEGLEPGAAALDDHQEAFQVVRLRARGLAHVNVYAGALAMLRISIRDTSVAIS